MSNIQYQSQNWAKISQMTPNIDNKFKQVLGHQHAIRKGSITKQFLKKYLGVKFNYKKKYSRNNSYTFRTRYQRPNTHSNDKLQQRHPKVPKGPD